MPLTLQPSPWYPAQYDITTPAVGAGTSGVVVTDTPATYDNGLWTCSRLQADATLIDKTQFWAFMYVRMGWASATPPGTPHLFQWGSGTNDVFVDWYSPSSAMAIFRQVSGSYDSLASTSDTFSAGDYRLYGFGMTASTLYISVNGAAWSTHAIAQGALPALPALFDIGSTDGSAGHLDSGNIWTSFGLSSPSAITPSDLYVLGATPPFKYAWTSTMHPTALLDATGSVPRLWRWSAP